MLQIQMRILRVFGLSKAEMNSIIENAQAEGSPSLRLQERDGEYLVCVQASAPTQAMADEYCEKWVQKLRTRFGDACYGFEDTTLAQAALDALKPRGVLAAVLYAAVFGLTDTLVSWFNSENSVQMAQYAHTGMRMYFVGYFFAGFNIMAAGYLSAVNRPAEASITSICRGMVAIVACSLVLSAVFGMPGVWAAFPASELLTVLLTLFLLRRKEAGKA